MKYEWKSILAKDFIEFNPKLNLKKGQIAKKVSMENVKAHSKYIKEFSNMEYTGGSKFQNEDTIMARITPCLENGKTAYIDFLNENEIGFGSTEFIVLRARKGISNSQFIYYLSISPEFRKIAINSMVGSSGRQRVQQGVLNEIELVVPNIENQKRIAYILNAIDEKIRINNLINDNLLEQTIEFYSMLTENKNKNGYIGDYCTIKSGFAFKSKWWQNTGIPVVKIASIKQDYLDLSNCSFVSEDKKLLAKDFNVKGGDLLIAMTGATIGKFSIVPKTTKVLLVNQRVGKFFLGDNPVNRLPYIYCTLKQQDVISEIINRGQGSAQSNISPSDIMSTPCVILQADAIEKFNKNFSPVFEIIINNLSENIKLKKVIDLLIPKLMSGKIDVSNINI